LKQIGKQEKQQPAPKAPEAPAPEAPSTKNDVILQAPTPDLNPRNRVLGEIAQRANSAADESAAETLPEGDGESMPQDPAPIAAAPSEPEAAPEAEEPAESQAAAPAAEPAAAPQIAGIDPNAEYEVQVDGQAVKLKGTQILSRVQKGEAADYRLELASKLLEEAKRTVAPQQQLPAEGVAQQAQPARQPISDEQLAEMIQFGTREQAAEAVRALNARRPDTVTMEGLQTFMAQQMPRIVDQQLAFREGANLVQKEYGDLLADADLKQLFFIKENAARKAGDKRFTELYREIGEDIRKKFNRPATTVAPAAPTQQAPAQTVAQRQAAKAAAPAAPRLASARLDGGSAQAKPKSREEIIAEMRQKRGQHALGVR
jgi:hypothetical protein